MVVFSGNANGYWDGNVIGSVDEAYIVVALVASAVRRCEVDLG